MIGSPVEDSSFIPIIQIAVDSGENPLHAGINSLFGKLAFLHGLDNPLVIGFGISGHLEIQAGPDALHPVVHSAPVRDDEALKAPVVAQHLRQEPLVVRRVGSVDLVVRAHNGPGLGLLDRRLKGREVDFPDGPLVGLRGDAHPAGLLIVQGEMLDGCADMLRLDTLDVGRRHLSGYDRVFGEVLEIAAAEGVPLDIDGRSEHHGQILRLALVSDGLAQLLFKVLVKGSRRRTACREADRLDRLVHAQVVRLLVLLPESVRAVGNHDGRNAQPLHGLRVPEILPAQERGLLLQGEFRNQLFDVCCHSFSPFMNNINPPVFPPLFL